MTNTLDFFNKSEQMLIGIMQEKSVLNSISSKLAVLNEEFQELSSKLSELQNQIDDTDSQYSTCEDSVVVKANQLESFVNNEKPSNLDFDAAMNLIKQRVNMLKEMGVLEIDASDDIEVSDVNSGTVEDGNSGSSDVEQPKKRKRRTKAEMEAERNASEQKDEVVESEDESVEIESMSNEEVSTSVEGEEKEIIAEEVEPDDEDTGFDPDDFINVEDEDEFLDDIISEEDEDEDEDGEISVPGFLA